MEDSAIIALYWQRAERAIMETQTKYGGFLTSFARRILRDESDTEEVVNDTYLGAWNTIPPSRPEALRHFLSRITRNLAFDRLDRRAAQKRGGTDAFFAELDECIPDARAGVEEQFDARECAASIDRFLAAQGARDRALFLDRYYYAYPLQELAKRFALSERQIKYRLSKLRGALRAQLERDGVEL